MKPRIFIGAPVYESVGHEVLQDWVRFAYHLGRRMPQYDFILGIKPKSEQFRARNDIVTGAIRNNCDYLLMLDDDMVIDSFDSTGFAVDGSAVGCTDYGFIEKLIAHDKDICGVLYWQRGGGFDPVLMYRATEDGYRFLREEEIENKLQKVDVAGGGCLLIKTRVFDKIGYPYFAPEFKYGTDVQLCKRAAEHGFEVWADTSIEIGHLKNDRVIVTRRNRRKLQMDYGVPGDVQRSLVTSDIYSRLMSDAVEFTGISADSPAWAKGIDFLQHRRDSNITDPDWYRLYSKERVVRQVAYNTLDTQKRRMTEFLIGNCSMVTGKKLLDFGCGIGITAFTLAENGHEVTACDIRGTGTLEFLKWRTAKRGVPMQFIESEGGVPELTEMYEGIVAMDSLEHIENWREALTMLAAHLVPGGVLFTNNGVLTDNQHPEHYADAMGKPFIQACLDLDLMPYGEIIFIKKGEVYGEGTNIEKDSAVYAGSA